MMYKYEMPVCEANMHAAVKEIIADMEAHNKEYPALMRKVVYMHSWSLGDESGETSSDFWQVVIYEKMTDLFYVHQICDDWDFGGRKVEKTMICLPKEAFHGFETVLKQEVA